MSGQSHPPSTQVLSTIPFYPAAWTALVDDRPAVDHRGHHHLGHSAPPHAATAADLGPVRRRAERSALPTSSRGSDDNHQRWSLEQPSGSALRVLDAFPLLSGPPRAPTASPAYRGRRYDAVRSSAQDPASCHHLSVCWLRTASSSGHLCGTCVDRGPAVHRWATGGRHPARAPHTPPGVGDTPRRRWTAAPKSLQDVTGSTSNRSPAASAAEPSGPGHGVGSHLVCPAGTPDRLPRRGPTRRWTRGSAGPLHRPRGCRDRLAARGGGAPSRHRSRRSHLRRFPPRPGCRPRRRGWWWTGPGRRSRRSGGHVPRDHRPREHRPPPPGMRGGRVPPRRARTAPGTVRWPGARHPLLGDRSAAHTGLAVRTPGPTLTRPAGRGTSTAAGGTRVAAAAQA